MELDDELHRRIKRLCSDGDASVDENDRATGIRLYREAWGLLPEPKHEWEAATWILTAIGDAQFSARGFAESRQSFEEALRCPGALGNPFIHLRLGESYFEEGDIQKALDQLARAYMAGGRKIFENQDSKYFLALQKVLKPQPGEHEL